METPSFCLFCAQQLESLQLLSFSHTPYPNSQLILRYFFKNTSDSHQFSPLPLWNLSHSLMVFFHLTHCNGFPNGLPVSTFVPPIASSKFRSQSQSFKTNSCSYSTFLPTIASYLIEWKQKSFQQPNPSFPIPWFTPIFLSLSFTSNFISYHPPPLIQPCWPPCYC